MLELVEGTDPAEVVGSTDEIIKNWSKLWGSVQGPLSLVQQRGLFGELLVLERFVQASGECVVHNWEGPDKALHDFAFQSRHVEVKVTGYEDPVLEISSFNQLRPCHPELVLLMIQMREGAQLSLPALVARIRHSLNAVPAELHEFEQRLEKARYFDEHAQHYPTPYEDFLFSSILIDDSVDVLHEDRLNSPIAGLMGVKWTLDPRMLAFTSIQDDFWMV